MDKPEKRATKNEDKQTNKNKKPTQYVLDTTIRKQTQIT